MKAEDRKLTTPSEYFKDYLREELNRIGFRAVLLIMASIFRDEAHECRLQAEILQFELDKNQESSPDDQKEMLKYCES